MEPKQVWEAVVGQLQMEMPKAAFDTWVKDASLVRVDDDTFVIGLQNAFARDWLEQRLTPTVTHMLSGTIGRKTNVDFVVWQGTNGPRPVVESYMNGTQEPVMDVEVVPEVQRSATLVSRYTFDNFVVGASNRLAHAASQAVAENPARSYNPLFLYGGVGLGKTHLLHAIGNACQDRGLAVLYVSSEEFTNDLITAIRTHDTQAFRDKYRRTDVLLVDDVQFIAGKESTQEEFFHTFNTLHAQDKQIVLSSDRPPKAMSTLEERLRSRFEWGLAADIQPPDYETRLAILQFKAETMGRADVPPEILELIARRMPSNIRELEGAFTRVIAYADLRGMKLSLDLVNAALGDLLPRQREIKPDQILDAVSSMFGVTVERLLGRDRSRQVALPRQVVMYLMREEANISLPQIGELLGGRDHTTVMYGCDKINDMMERDHKLRRQVLDIREQLYGPSMNAAY